LSAVISVLKKTFTATERDTEKNIEKRRVFEAELKNIPEKYRVYLDEAGTNLGMTRMNSRSEIGERASSKRPSNRGTNISLIGAVRLNEEPVLYPFDGAVDGEKFVFFLREKLLPILKDGDVVIMDNCRIHYVKEVAEILKTVGARPLFLPPYSPELNPIEEAWSLIKYVFKSLEARTVSAYIDAMKIARKIVTKEKINQYYQHANSFLATT
jgi:transposase